VSLTVVNLPLFILQHNMMHKVKILSVFLFSLESKYKCLYSYAVVAWYLWICLDLYLFLNKIDIIIDFVFQFWGLMFYAVYRVRIAGILPPKNVKT
jgi:hypothetical protein